MTEKFSQCIPVVLRNEGGYVNNKKDPGGATKYGVSLRFLKSTGDLEHYDLDDNGYLDANDIKLLDQDQAKYIFFTFFWQRTRIEEIADIELALQVFDHAVNAGVNAAVKILQHAVNVFPDGILGDHTLQQTNQMENIAEKYRQRRKNWYTNLAFSHSNRLSIFLNGWLVRCDYTTLKS